MSELKQLLYDDLSRQYELEGKAGVRPNFVGFIARFLHYRFLPNVICRTSRALYLAGVPVLPNLFTYLNILMFGLEVTPRCQIGPGIFFAHAYGTVIGGTRVGSGATIFQGVTIGAKTLEMRFDPALRPTIGDNVVLGAGCKILGGIHLGDGVTVGANAVVLDSVEPHTTVVGVPARVVGFGELSGSSQSVGQEVEPK
jgi:serine O-acetyltransferase